MKIIGAALGECVHIQGIYGALELAREAGHDTRLLGPAQSVDQLIERIKMDQPDAVALSYRLTPETGKAVIQELINKLDSEGLREGRTFLFGGTPPVAQIAREANLFDIVIHGPDIEQYVNFLQSNYGENKERKIPPQTAIERIKWKKTRPILRAHFGQPTLDATIRGIEEIAQAGALDVISLGTDQDAQANFFHPERQLASRAGAGGVPVRSEKDFKRLFEATREGNFPLMRAYAGTDDLIQLAEMYDKVWGNAWSAVPIFWFNDMDGRGPHSLDKSVREHLKLIKWNAEHDVPVEILEAHHWGMRWAHDSMQVASAILGAKITKKLGAKNYFHQYMFHLPPTTSFRNELAKMLAVQEMLGEIEEPEFNVYHQTRAGLPSLPCDLEAARSQLAVSTSLQMQLNPDIIHVVSYSEPHHAATAKDVIASAKIVDHAIDKALGSPSMKHDPYVIARKNELVGEAKTLLEQIQNNGRIDDPTYLHSIVTSGLFDAPMLIGNRYANGNVRTSIIEGGCYAIEENGTKLNETRRISLLER